MIKSYPVSIIKNCNSFQRFFKFFVIFEIERIYFYSFSKRIFSADRICKCLNSISFIQKFLCNIFSRISESTCYSMNLLIIVQICFLSKLYKPYNVENKLTHKPHHPDRVVLLIFVSQSLFFGLEAHPVSTSERPFPS
jgi:hypothetical protein